MSHTDLKPSNIIISLTSAGLSGLQATVTDLGGAVVGNRCEFAYSRPVELDLTLQEDKAVTQRIAYQRGTATHADTAWAACWIHFAAD